MIVRYKIDYERRKTIHQTFRFMVVGVETDWRTAQATTWAHCLSLVFISSASSPEKQSQNFVTEKQNWWVTAVGSRKARDSTVHVLYIQAKRRRFTLIDYGAGAFVFAIGSHQGRRRRRSRHAVTVLLINSVIKLKRGDSVGELWIHLRRIEPEPEPQFDASLQLLQIIVWDALVAA